MAKCRKTLARRLFTGVLMDASDERVADMFNTLTEYNRSSPVTMTVLRTIPFVGDLIETIKSEYTYRTKKIKKK